MRIYTKTGDTGDTGLFDGTRVMKDDLRIETYGTVDELNSVLGTAIAACTPPELHPLAALLTRIQCQLFDAGADLATPLGGKNESKIRRIGPDHITFLEGQIDAATAQLPPLSHFVLPGGTPAAAHLHLARTVCRRAERLLVTLTRMNDLGPHILIYFNRLSDLLFTLARLANHLTGKPDIQWHAEGSRVD